MPSIKSSPYKQMDDPATLLSLLRPRTSAETHNTTTSSANRSGAGTKKTKSSGRKSTGSGGGLLRMFKLFPLLTSGCKMVALLGRTRRNFIADHATIGTIFGHRRGRVTLAIQEDTHSQPIFILELPILSSAFHNEMASDILRIALESETRTNKRTVMEEFVWAVYCNGRKIGYSIRRKHMNDEEQHVMQVLKGVSMGAGVVPCTNITHAASDGIGSKGDGESMTYLRARFERVVGSKDSEALYMINPNRSDGPELSIFFVRLGK